MIKQGLAIAVVLSLLTAASAQAGVNQRQKNQKSRIADGVASGQLTKREAAKLAAAQVKIAAMEARMRADGKLTAKERAKLKASQDKANVKIVKQKHDGQKQKDK